MGGKETYFVCGKPTGLDEIKRMALLQSTGVKKYAEEDAREEAGGEVLQSSAVEFFGTEDVAKCLGCTPGVARQIMKRRDFPLIMVGKNMRVSKLAFEVWAMERRV